MMAADWTRLTREIEALGLRVLWINKTNGEITAQVPGDML